jgi:spore coat protein H
MTTPCRWIAPLLLTACLGACEANVPVPVVPVAAVALVAQTETAAQQVTAAPTSTPTPPLNDRRDREDAPPAARRPVTPQTVAPPPAPQVAEGPTPADVEALFGNDAVHTLTLTYVPSDFQAQQADLAAQLGPFGSAAPVAKGQKIPAAVFAACDGKAMGAKCVGLPGHPSLTGFCTQPGGDDPVACMPPGYQFGDPIDTDPAVKSGQSTAGLEPTPMWVPVTLTLAGETLPWVGMRYKGHESLTQAWTTGRAKLPFRLDFDHYAAGHPETQARKVHGFTKLTLATGWGDSTYLRDVLASEILRDRGVPAPRAAFYRVLVDHGDGAAPVYAGLYIAVEDPSDVLPARDLGAKGGNVYKPQGVGADWTQFDAPGFGKANHVAAADFSDVQAAVAALGSPQTDAVAWRAGLAKAFDVDGFLRWLAVDTALSNLDVYGHVAHNYYLVGVPAEGGRLHWVPWDHNMTLSASGPPSGTQGAAPNSPLAILHADVGQEWPLIRKLLDDPVLKVQYEQELALAIQGAYTAEAFATRAQVLHDLIAPHVTGPGGEAALYSALPVVEGQGPTLDSPQALIGYAGQMRAAVAAVVGK